MIEWYWYVLGATLTAIIVGVVVYLLKFSKNSQALTVNKTGVSAISAVIVRDLTNKTGGFNSGDVVQLEYIGVGSGSVRWEYQVGKSSAPFHTAFDSTTTNPANWKIPADTFGAMTLRVTSVDDLTVQASSKPYTVQPIINFTGVGDVASRHFVNIGSAVVFKYSQMGPWMTVGNIALQTASNFLNNQFKDYTPVDPKSLQMDPTKNTVTWMVSGLRPNLYKLKFVTTNLVSKGFPNELSYTLPSQIGVQDDVGYNMGGTYATITVKHESGRQGGFAPGENITLTFSGFEGPISDSHNIHDYHYSQNDGNTYVKFITGSSKASESWLIPTDLDGSILIRAVPIGGDPKTQNPSEYAQTEINVGVYLMLYQDGAEKIVPVEYNNQPNPVGTLEFAVVGYADPKVLSDVNSWNLGWLTDPSSVSTEDMLTPFSIVPNGVDVGTGFPISDNTAKVIIRYVDPGFKIAPKIVPMIIQARLPLGGKGTQTVLVTAVTQTQYSLMK